LAHTDIAECAEQYQEQLQMLVVQHSAR
jgi:hypothetical protein